MCWLSPKGYIGNYFWRIYCWSVYSKELIWGEILSHRISKSVWDLSKPFLLQLIYSCPSALGHRAVDFSVVLLSIYQ